MFCIYSIHITSYKLAYLSIATLVISQGRISFIPQVNVEVIPVIGIATVELGGDSARRLLYYFDCITDLSNGTDLIWTRLTSQHRFEVEPIPDGRPGIRLSAEGLDYVDLDIYICSDQISNDVTTINITACELISHSLIDPHPL